MPRLHLSALSLFPVLCLAVVAGCATTDTGRPTSIESAKAPAWSAKALPNEMMVSVSPAGKSLRLLGTSGIVLGAGADAVVNAKYREPIQKALEGYDAAEVFAGIIQKRLDEAAHREIPRVAPLGSTAGMNSRQEAEDARYRGLAKSGYDVLLDLTMTYGIYGPEGTLATKLDGKLVLLPDGKRLWNDVIVVSNDPVLITDKLGNVTKRGGYNLTPEFTVDSEKVKRWTADGGALLKQRFEKAANDAVSALLCELGLEDNAPGRFALGDLAMNRKDFKDAAVHFKRAVELDPENLKYRNAYAVDLARNGQVDDAIAVAKKVTEVDPQFGPAWYNLAYWYAVEKKDVAAAKDAYDKAQSLGMPKDKKVEKAIRKG